MRVQLPAALAQSKSIRAGAAVARVIGAQPFNNGATVFDTSINPGHARAGLINAGLISIPGESVSAVGSSFTSI